MKDYLSCYRNPETVHATCEDYRAAATVDAPFEGYDLPWSAVQLSLRPHEIATVMFDLEAGRWIPRDLDRYRHVWATVHRDEA